VDVEVEGGVPGGRRGERALDVGEPRGLDVAEELQREMDVVAGDPGDVGGERAESLDRRRQPRAQAVVQQDGDERARGGRYRGDSRRRIRPWMWSRRAGSDSMVAALRRSASAPSWSPSSSREMARVASARASTARADGTGEADGDAGGVAASVAGGGSGTVLLPMPGGGAGATVPTVVG
jgi:hypothetical protein